MILLLNKMILWYFRLDFTVHNECTKPTEQVQSKQRGSAVQSAGTELWETNVEQQPHDERSKERCRTTVQDHSRRTRRERQACEEKQ